MTITAANLRTDFPEFTDATKYPDTLITMWLAVAYKLIDSSRWDTLTDLGAELFTAHNLVLQARSEAEANTGGIPGGASGMLSSKSVDRVSAGYDTSSVAEKNAGHWNLTTYGLRFYRLNKMFGAGPVHLGVGEIPSLTGTPWVGPYSPISY